LGGARRAFQSASFAFQLRAPADVADASVGGVVFQPARQRISPLFRRAGISNRIPDFVREAVNDKRIVQQ